MKMTPIQRAIAADRIRRERARVECQANLRQTYRDGVTDGKAKARAIRMPEPLLHEVLRRAAHIMARQVVEQNRERSPQTVKVLADIVEHAVAEFPYSVTDAKELAEYFIRDDGVRFDFRIENVTAKQVVSWQDVESFKGDGLRMDRP